MMPFSMVPDERLYDLMGAKLLEGDVEWINMVHGDTGPVVPNAMIREHAEIISPLLSGRRTLVLGVITAWAFRCLQRPLEWRQIKDGAISWMPQFGTMWWNDQGNLLRAQMFLQDLGQQLRKGEI